MLKYWSNAFMTTGSAIVATAVFTDFIGFGVLIGTYLIIIGAILYYCSI